MAISFFQKSKVLTTLDLGLEFKEVQPERCDPEVLMGIDSGQKVKSFEFLELMSHAMGLWQLKLGSPERYARPLTSWQLFL